MDCERGECMSGDTHTHTHTQKKLYISSTKMLQIDVKSLASITQIPLDEHHHRVPLWCDGVMVAGKYFIQSLHCGHMLLTMFAANHHSFAAAAAAVAALSNSCKYKQNNTNWMQLLIVVVARIFFLFDFCCRCCYWFSLSFGFFAFVSLRKLHNGKVYSSLMPKLSHSHLSVWPTFSIYWNELFKSFPLSK